MQSAEDLRNLLSAQSNLKEFELFPGRGDNGKVGYTIEVIGAGLRRLALGVKLSHEARLTRMFQSIGREELDGNDSMFDVSKIADFCPHITDITLSLFNESDTDSRDKEIQLYCKNGEQLQTMSLTAYAYSKEFFETLASHCPSARIDIPNIQNGALHAIETLGSQIFDIFPVSRDISPSDLITVESKLSGVASLSIFTDLAHAFFSYPKPNLRRLTLVTDDQRPVSLTDEDWITIARSTCDLRTFTWHGPRIPVEKMQMIAAANRRLEQVLRTSTMPPCGRRGPAAFYATQCKIVLRTPSSFFVFKIMLRMFFQCTKVLFHVLTRIEESRTSTSSSKRCR